MRDWKKEYEGHNKKDIEMELLKMLRPVEADKGVELKIVRYRINGNSTAPQLVAQNVYTDIAAKKRRRSNGVTGLRWGDWKFLTSNPEMIAKIQESLVDSVIPKEKPQSYAKERAANDDTPREEETVPF